MTASSSHSRRYDVFPSFSGEDVRKSFLSHLLKELDRKSINTFIDHGIERSRPIGPELLSAIRESRISIVIFSKNYASSTWCLNELAEIHNCFKELDQMVIPVFYDVDPSDARKQTGEFGEAFTKTCKGKMDEEKQRWIQALAEVANMAGEDRQNWCNDANMIEKIVDDVSRKLITPSKRFGELVGIEEHIEAMNSLLCLESEEPRMLGILGPSGIGKSTIGRALFNQIKTQFKHYAFVSYERTKKDDYGTKLCWEEQFLSEILRQKDIKVSQLGAVEQRLQHMKVLIVLDDVDDIELLKTLVGEPGWFGSGSRIIVITQDKGLLNAHDIDLIYEVKFPSEDLALKMLCQSAFGKSSPPYDFKELAVKVARLAGNLPLGLSVLGSSLKGKDIKQWIDMLPRLQNGLDGKIERLLRLGYDRLDRNDKELFLYIASASLFKNMRVSDIIKHWPGDSVNTGLSMLADKSLIRITPLTTVEMHSLLQMLGKEIVRAEYINNPEKCQFLVDAKDIRQVFTDKTGTENLLGIYLNTTDIKEPFSIDENSFHGMRNLQFLIVRGPEALLKSEFDLWLEDLDVRTSEVKLYLPKGLVYLPPKLRLLKWNDYPSKCLPSNFKAKFLVELTMQNSSLEKLWEGTRPLRSLKKLRMSGSKYLKELPDLSNAINLEEVYLSGCTSLVTLPSSVRNLLKLQKLDLKDCTKLKNFPIQLNLDSLQHLDLRGCIQLKEFPQIYMSPRDQGCIIKVKDCLWNKNLPGLDYLDCLMACMPSKFRPEHLVNLTIKRNMLQKLWEGVQSLENLKTLDLSKCENLTEIPDLSKATNLRILNMKNCKSLMMIPSSVGNLNKLDVLNMKGCTRLELLPTGVNLMSLVTVNLDGCSRLKSFPQISTNSSSLSLDHTAIEEVPSWIENFDKLVELRMSGCKELRRISSNIFKLKRLKVVDFSNCEGVTSLSNACTTYCDQLPVPDKAFYSFTEFCSKGRVGFNFHNCFNLDRNSRESIIRSDVESAILPGGEMPTYFMYQADGSSLTITLPQSSLSQEILRFKVCVMLDPPTDFETWSSCTGVYWHLRGKRRVYHVNHPYNMEGHLFMFSFGLSTKEVNDLLSESSSNDLGFEFFTHKHDLFLCNDFSSEQSEIHPLFCKKMTNCLPLTQRIKRCGVRVLTVSPDSTGTSSEFEYNQRENDAT